MAEYIERGAAIRAAEHAYNEWNLAMATADGKREINLVFKRQELCKAVASVFENASAADVAPVRHGRWLEADEEIYECSECRTDWVFSEASPKEMHLMYCPICGAKMDGGVGDAAD